MVQKSRRVVIWCFLMELMMMNTINNHHAVNTNYCDKWFITIVMAIVSNMIIYQCLITKALVTMVNTKQRDYVLNCGWYFSSTIVVMVIIWWRYQWWLVPTESSQCWWPCETTSGRNLPDLMGKWQHQGVFGKLFWAVHRWCSFELLVSQA